jgi:hypothetical protein
MWKARTAATARARIPSSDAMCGDLGAEASPIVGRFEEGHPEGVIGADHRGIALDLRGG